MFEVWAEWGATSTPRHRGCGLKVAEDGAGGGKEEEKEKGMGEGRDKVKVQCRSLLGLSRFPPNTLFDQMMGLVVVPIGPFGETDSSCQERSTETVLIAAVHLGESWREAESAMAKSLSPYHALSNMTSNLSQPADHTHARENSQARLSTSKNLISFDFRSEEERKMTTQEMTMMEESDEGRGRVSGGRGDGKAKEGERARDVQIKREREGEREPRSSSRLVPFYPPPVSTLTPLPLSLGRLSISHVTDQGTLSHAPRNEEKEKNFLSALDHSATEVVTAIFDEDRYGTSVEQVRSTDTHLSQGQGQGGGQGGRQGQRQGQGQREGNYREVIPSASSTSCHILDVTIEGVASFLSAAGEELGLHGSLMGCFVVYSFPALAVNVQPVQIGNSQENVVQRAENERRKKVGEVEVEEVEVLGTSQLWWDVECPVLNGRVRHVFDLPTSFPSASTLPPISVPVPVPTPMSEETSQADTDSPIDYTDTRTAVKAIAININNNSSSSSSSSNNISRGNEGSILIDNNDPSRDGILFHIYCSDPDGCLPPPREREAVGTAHLTGCMLRQALSLCGTKTYSLSISFCNTNTNTNILSESHPSSQMEYQHPTQHRTQDNSILLSLSHRLQPVLLHRSLDLSSPSPSAVSSSALSSAPLAVIARAKSVRPTNTHNHGTHGTPLTPVPPPLPLPLPPLDEGVSLTSYQKLQRGLFSWENRSQSGLGGKLAVPITASQNAELIMPNDSRTDAHATEYETKDSSAGDIGEEKEGLGVGGVAGVAVNSGESFLPRQKESGAPVRVTVGKVSNLPAHIIPQYSPQPPLPYAPSSAHTLASSSSNLTLTADPEHRVRAFLFCVLEPFDSTGDEVCVVDLCAHHH